MQAALETGKVIRIQVEKWFYEGKTDGFVLYDGPLRIELEVDSISETEAAFIYLTKPVSEIDVSKSYFLYEKHARKCLLAMGSYVRSEEFEEQFYYDGDDLGPVYSRERTTFKLWAPLAQSVILRNHTDNTVFLMTREDRGVWVCTLEKDCDGLVYTYIINNPGALAETPDPYALTSTANSRESIVIDPSKFTFEINKDHLPEAKKLHEVITYELSVRDYTYQQQGSTFKALTEKMDYIENLGITNLQLLPVFDFETVNEEDRYAFYNWGYDPYNYNVLDGSFVDNPNDPYERGNGFGALISEANQRGIRVTMDVVYNHLYDAFHALYNRIVPGYYSRFNADGSYSNGSFCGNDFRSEGRMVRKFIVDSVCMFVRLYGVDGFRFDLMGDMDVETMNQIKQAVGPNVLIYGEGWNMPSALPEADRACIENQEKMPNISHFNDRYRNAFRGTSNHHGEQGLIFGQEHHQHHLRELIFGSPHVFNDISKSLNYIECHDNHTFYDWLKTEQHMDNQEELYAACSAGISAVLLAFGAPFIHAGQEFMRTKQGVENSYNAPDSINQFDWNRVEENRQLIDYTRALIHFRKSQPEYCMPYVELAKEVTYTENTPNVIELRSDTMRVLMNFSTKDIPVEAVDESFLSNLAIEPGMLKKHQICFKSNLVNQNT